MFTSDFHVEGREPPNWVVDPKLANKEKKLQPSYKCPRDEREMVTFS